MKRLVALFTDPRFLGLLGVVALSLAIWFGGSYIHIGDPPEPLSAIARLLIIMVVVILWGANNLRVQAQQNKKNKEMLGDIEQSVEQEAAQPSASDMTSEEAKVLYSRFKEAVETLKTHRFGDAKKKRTIYELPWYVIIGPPGAGKTTVLVNSGLQFPLKEKFGLQSVGGVGGTRNCDWWFTDEAVLIDTAGRYTTQDSHGESDKGAWNNFLKLLKKHRPRRAINGAVVAVSLQELMMQSRDERVRHAETIRSRVQELMGDLGIKFPIYFLLTKADLMAGFNEFFEYLDQSEREQVWGVSFPLNESESGQTSRYFESEFDNLVTRINERLLWRLHHERDPYRRAKIQSFPSQFENMREVLAEFVANVFGENQYQTPPLLRGIYFTSGTQEGSPIDRILNSLSANYGVQGQGMAPPPGQGKSFFINRLLKEVIFPEADIVGVNTKYEGKLRWLRRLAMFGTALVVLGAGAAWTTSLNKNEALMNEVSSLVAQHKTAVENKNSTGNRFEAAMAIMAPLRQATETYDQLELPWITGLGLYDASVQDAAHDAYDAALRAHFNPVLIKRLEAYLLGSTDNDALYDALRVYLMMGDRSKIEKNEVIDWFKRDWEKSFKGQAGKQDQLAVYLSKSLDNGIPQFSYKETVVNRTRNLLRKIPIEQRIYKQIERTPELRLQTDIVQAIGGDVLTVFSVDGGDELLLPFMFTKAGYDQMDFSKDSPLINKYATEQWILGTAATEDFSDKDIEQIAEKVKDIYLANYTKTWKSLIEKLSISDFSNSNQARDALATVSDKAISPLVKTLAVVTSETALTPEVNLLQGEDGAVAGAAAALAAKALPPTFVDTSFKPVHTLIKQNKIDDLLATLKSLQETMEEFSFAPIPNEASLKFASKRFSGSGSDPIRKLLAQGSKLPQPVRRWMEELADQSWKVILIDSKQHLNTVWQASVYQSYQSSIGSRYPFVKSSEQDVALLDFAEYFKPEGVEASFVNQHLKPFIKQGKRWTEKSLNGRSLGFDKNTLKQLQKASAIRSVFFRKSGSAPGFDYKFKPRKMDSTVRRFELNLGQGSVKYSHGPKLTKEFSWPGTTGDGIRVLFEDINETKHKNSYAGDWAFFRLLDDANVKGTKRANIFHLTFDVAKREAEYELSATSALNPFSPGWLNQYKCPKYL